MPLTRQEDLISDRRPPRPRLESAGGNIDEDLSAGRPTPLLWGEKKKNPGKCRSSDYCQDCITRRRHKHVGLEHPDHDSYEKTPRAISEA